MTLRPRSRKSASRSFSGRRERSALAEEFDLFDDFMWAGDHPHPEGSWPHSAGAIERHLGGLRAKILGLNAARLFRLPVPNGKGSA